MVGMLVVGWRSLWICFFRFVKDFVICTSLILYIGISNLPIYSFIMVCTRSLILVLHVLNNFIKV